MPAQSAASAVEDDVDDDRDVYYNSAEDAGVYYRAKLTFFHAFPVRICDAYYNRIFTVILPAWLKLQVAPSYYIILWTMLIPMRNQHSP